MSGVVDPSKIVDMSLVAVAVASKVLTSQVLFSSVPSSNLLHLLAACVTAVNPSSADAEQSLKHMRCDPQLHPTSHFE